MVNYHNTFTQKCWVSLPHFTRLSIPPGTCARITPSTKACPLLCELYPNKSLSSELCLLQSTVQTLPDGLEHLSLNNSLSLRPVYAPDLQIAPIRSTSQPTLIEVTVVVKSHKDIPQLKSYPHGLPSLVKDLLIPYNFINQSAITLDPPHPLGITSLLVLGSDSPPDHLINFSSQTCLKITKLTTQASLLESLQNSRIILGGLTSPYAELKRLITLPLFRSRILSELGLDCAKSILLHGPPGCGKTSLVKKLSVDCEAALFVIPGASLSSPNPGETEELLRDKIQEAVEASADGPCILFLDEIDVLCPRRGSGHSHETRVVTQLLTLLDRLKAEPNIVFIGATNRVEELDPAVRRPGRLNKEVYIGVPSAAERKDIITKICEALGLKLDCDVDWLSELTPGYVGADLALLCQEVACRVKEQLITVYAMLFKQVVAEIRPTIMRKGLGVVDFRPVAWSQIGGLENAKHYVERAIEWPLKYPDAFHRLGIEKPKGVLLYGPPGCGKSLLVRAAATSCSVTFLSVSAAEVFSPYVGDSEKTVSNLFQRARLAAPCILFLDELDAMVGDRSQTQGQRAQASVISTFLQEMDGVALHSALSSKLGSKLSESETSPEIQMITDKVKSEGVLVVGATNRPDKIDPALLRPGRLDSLVYIPPPDLSTRNAILRVHTSKMPLKDVNLEEIAEQTNCFSGADLEVLCKEAGLKALEENMEAVFVTQKHFLSALRSVKPSLNTKIVNWYENYQSNR